MLKHPSLQRRHFLKSSLATSLVAPKLLSPLDWLSKPASTNQNEITTLAETLLQQWCHGLLANQTNKPEDLTVHGGIYSPGDKAYLGRCADALYPFCWMASHSGDERFLDAAKKVYNWEQHNCSLDNGAWTNDPGKPRSWNGITVFGAITKLEAIQHYPELLGAETVTAWKNRLHRAAEFVFKSIHIGFSNINFPAVTTTKTSTLPKPLSLPMES